jgi:putative Mn2+ efflux pump MntP
MKMKLSRKTLLIITAVLALILIGYSAFRMITKTGLPEKWEKYLIDGVIIAALGVFMYNRKLAKDERKAREAAERAGMEEQVPLESGDEEKPHWERSNADREN